MSKSTESPFERALNRLSSLVLETGERWGEVAAPFQWEDAEAVLDPDSEQCCFFFTRSRGGSKTSDQAAIGLVVMLEQAPAGARLYALAADLGQALHVLHAMRGYCARTPSLDGLVSFTETRAITASGVVFEVLPADTSGTWGLRPYFLVLDELAQWQETRRARELFHAASTASIKINGRMVILTTAGRPSHWAHEVLEHAKADPLWFVHEVSGPAPWLSPARLESERAARPPSVYGRLFENCWMEDEDRLAAIANIRELVRESGTLDPRTGITYFIGVDLATSHDLCAAVVLHCERIDPSPNGSKLRRVVVDRLLTWVGTPQVPVSLEEVEMKLIDVGGCYNQARFVIDPWQGIGMAERLRKRGFKVVEFSFTGESVGRLAETLVGLIRQKLLSIPNDLGLVRELERVRLVERTPGVIRMDHDPGDHDDRATALALAAHQAQQTPEPYRGSRLLVAPDRPLRHFGGWRLH